ncbi:hypothetical protein JCM10207_002758 [Rhodosporidiobolus poonsookiae]
MPFIDVPEQHLTVFYVLNPLEHISYPTHPTSVDPSVQDPDIRCAAYDPSKPTLVFLHAGCRSVAQFGAQLHDTRLKSRFNLLAFARHYHGRTRFFGSTDKEHTLEESADGAIATLDALCARFGIKQYSVFAEGIAGCHVGTTLAIRRPQQVLSMILSSPGHMRQTSSPVSIGLCELLAHLCQNKDGKGDGTGTIPEEVLEENAEYCFGNAERKVGELRKVHNEAFQRRYGTGHSSYDLTQLFYSEARRTGIPEEERMKVECPILVLHGTKDTLICPRSAAEEWQRGFPNSKGGAELKPITGGPHLLSFIEGNVVNRIILGFVSQTVTPDTLHDHIRRTSIVR